MSIHRRVPIRRGPVLKGSGSAHATPAFLLAMRLGKACAACGEMFYGTQTYRVDFCPACRGGARRHVKGTPARQKAFDEWMAEREREKLKRIAALLETWHPVCGDDVPLAVGTR